MKIDGCITVAIYCIGVEYFEFINFKSLKTSGSELYTK